MNALRNAAVESVRALGINVPTMLTGMLGIGLSILIAVNLADPDTDSVTGFMRWLVESIARFTAVVLVFAPLLVWNFIKAMRREQSIKAKLEMVADIAASKDDRMKSFLQNALGSPFYGIAECYVFGSVVRRDPTRDVDIVVKFDTTEEGLTRIYRDRIKNIEENFKEFHDLELHLQTFLSDQDENVRNFLKVAGEHERII